MCMTVLIIPAAFTRTNLRIRANIDKQYALLIQFHRESHFCWVCIMYTYIADISVVIAMSVSIYSTWQDNHFSMRYNTYILI